MENIFWIIGIMIWIGFGIVSYGISFANLQKMFPKIAQEQYKSDIIISLFVGLCGPLGFIVLASFGELGHCCGMKFK